jgi:hypothetical protein
VWWKVFPILGWWQQGSVGQQASELVGCQWDGKQEEYAEQEGAKCVVREIRHRISIKPSTYDVDLSTRSRPVVVAH